MKVVCLFFALVALMFSEHANACQRCCATDLAVVPLTERLWSEEDLLRLKEYYLSSVDLPPRIRKHIDELTLERLNSVHARMIHLQLKAKSEFDGGFDFNTPFVSSGTAQIMESGTKLNISIDNIRLLRADPKGSGRMEPLNYGEVPSNPREAFELINDLVTAIARLGFEAAGYFPNLKIMVLSALSVRVERTEGVLKENRLLRLIQGKFGFNELVDPHAPQSIVLQLRIPLKSPSGLQPLSDQKLKLFNADAAKIDEEALLRRIRELP